MRIAAAVDRVRQRVSEACARAGRDPQEVTIVAVSKGRPGSDVDAVVRAGIPDVAENRAQELRDKAREVAEAVRWHFVGAIQTNKVRYLDDVVLVHGLVRTVEAEALDRRAQRIGRAFDVLVEVNVAGERTKQGVAPPTLEDFLERLGRYPGVRPVGLMMMAPEAERAEDVRWAFAEARRLRDRVRNGGIEELSMGMSDDFEVAVEEGATLVRVGRAIFGEE